MNYNSLGSESRAMADAVEVWLNQKVQNILRMQGWQTQGDSLFKSQQVEVDPYTTLDIGVAVYPKHTIISLFYTVTSLDVNEIGDEPQLTADQEEILIRMLYHDGTNDGAMLNGFVTVYHELVRLGVI